MITFRLLVGLLPAVLFLAALMVMDSYKLVGRMAIVRSLAIGGAAAIVALLLNVSALRSLHVDLDVLRRDVAPVLEELLKAAFVLWLIRAGRVGFMVDAGLHGFALGTGFALVENIYYASTLVDYGPLVWIVRGLGTAVMHGSTTSMVAILAKGLTDRHGSHAVRWYLPGIGIAIALHAFFNHLVLHPLVMTALLLLVMPLLLLLVFERSERATEAWLGAGLDNDMEMLESVLNGQVHESPVGHYLESLKAHFTPTAVADMLCLLQVHAELSLAAKGILMARAAGIEIPLDESVRANLEEMRFLERSIGPTGRLALTPILRAGSRDLWQIQLLARRL